jgi:hypothetical protein
VLIGAVERASGHAHAELFSRYRVEPMVWDEVREMAAAGMLIGAHTATHQVLAAASSEEVVTELVTSRRTIASHIGRECWCFSYPNGEAADFRETDIHTLKASGFECAFTQMQGFVDPERNPHALSRLGVPSTENFRVFLSRATGFIPLLAPSSTGLRRWARAS